VTLDLTVEEVVAIHSAISWSLYTAREVNLPEEIENLLVVLNNRIEEILECVK